jgi:hypothetical protein
MNIQGEKEQEMNIHMLRGIFAGLLIFCLSGSAWAQHGHSHGGPAASKGTEAKDSTPSKGSVQTVTLEGMKISLEVMNMGDHMKHTTKGSAHGEADHSKSHSLMVTLLDVASKEIISDAEVAFVISTPSGKKDSGKLTWSGDHYGAGADLKEKGKYQVQLRMESGGTGREAKFTYEVK